MDTLYYQEQVRKLREHLARVRYGMIKGGPRILIDNASIHTARETVALFKKLGLKLVEHPPYSPDLAPSDYYLFINFKSWQRGQKYSSREDLETRVTDWFQGKRATYYERGIDELKTRSQAVIKSVIKFLTQGEILWF